MRSAVPHAHSQNTSCVLPIQVQKWKHVCWSMPAYFLPLPLPSCLSVGIHHMFPESSTVLTNGDIEAGRRLSLPTRSSLHKMSILRQQGGPRWSVGLQGKCLLFSARVSGDAGGLPGGGGMHTNCIHSPLWGTLLPTQQGPHTVPKVAVLGLDQICLLSLVSEPCMLLAPGCQTVRVHCLLAYL